EFGIVLHARRRQKLGVPPLAWLGFAQVNLWLLCSASSFPILVGRMTCLLNSALSFHAWAAMELGLHSWPGTKLGIHSLSSTPMSPELGFLAVLKRKRGAQPFGPLQKLGS
ncbi:hypothetical protein Dimus_033468, partial [Dionaea muscipula]